jgi:hypothetical protein
MIELVGRYAHRGLWEELSTKFFRQVCDGRGCGPTVCVGPGGDCILLTVDHQRAHRDSLFWSSEAIGNRLPKVDRSPGGVGHDQRARLAIRRQEGSRRYICHHARKLRFRYQPPAAIALAAKAARCAPLAEPTDGLPRPPSDVIEGQ